MKPHLKGSQSSYKKKKESSWMYLVPPLTVLLGFLAVFGYNTFTVDTLSGKENKESNLWRIDYWKTPIPFQGKAPETYHPLAQNIRAKDCSKCHLDKFKEWSSSLHSHTMGAGVVGQYPHFSATQVAQCDGCHAPMSEQWPQVKLEGKWVSNLKMDESLRKEGITCAACHLRKHQRNGPPSKPGKESLSQALHGDANKTPFFETSEFCRGCHQHEANTLKIGGKTIENTYMEWLDSPAFEEGKTCQSCHMPDRKHLWKGIHDRQMTLDGVSIKHTVSMESPVVGQPFKATLTIANTGVGHMFPTYTTPAVFLKAVFLDVSGKVIPKFYEEKIIQRRLNTSKGSWQEYFDTRLAPNESVTLDFKKTVPPSAVEFKLWIWVQPDHFYEGFYKTMLRNNSNHKGKELLEQALQNAKKRQYSLFSQTWQVAPASVSL